MTRFLQTSTLFLVEFEDAGAKHPLRTRVPCIAMLTLHVKWLCLNEDATSVISQVGQGEHLFTIVLILDLAVAMMVHAMEEENDRGGTVGFRLSERDVRSIKIWNDFWRTQDKQTPLIDAGLIRLADQFK